MTMHDKKVLIAHRNDWERAKKDGNGIVGWLAHLGVPVEESGRVPRGQLWIVGPDGYERRHHLFGSRTPGQIAYEEDVAARPLYDDGTPRKPWCELPDEAKRSWDLSPTARYSPSGPQPS